MDLRNRKVTEAAKGASVMLKKLKKKVISFFRTVRKGREVPLSASITLEASLVLPLFMFFVVNIMTAFNIIKLQSELEAALHQTGNDIAVLAQDLRFGKELIGSSGEDTGGLTEYAASGGYTLYAGSKVRNYLGKRVDNSFVTGGAGGISFLGSKIMAGNDYIDIVADYKVHPLISLIGFKEFTVESRYFGHAWTGYDVSSSAPSLGTEEEMVFVTEHGTVYHRSASCSHLKVDIRSIPFESLKNQRNSEGSIYYPCEYCAVGIGGGNVFVTEYGNRYHSSVTCPGLKRKIYTIPISQVGGRGPCSTCGH